MRVHICCLCFLLMRYFAAFVHELPFYVKSCCLNDLDLLIYFNPCCMYSLFAWHYHKSPFNRTSCCTHDVGRIFISVKLGQIIFSNNQKDALYFHYRQKGVPFYIYQKGASSYFSSWKCHCFNIVAIVLPKLL